MHMRSFIIGSTVEIPQEKTELQELIIHVVRVPHFPDHLDEDPGARLTVRLNEHDGSVLLDLFRPLHLFLSGT